MDPKIIKKTQDALGKIIKRPPLTEKLLNKPPFRFLHDVVMEVVRTTSFGKGLYNETETDSKNVTVKEDKLRFLQKLIDCVTFASGETVTARPSKIIAGHEPEKTNELLQLIAKCIRKNISSDDAVQRVLKGETSSKPRDKMSSGKRQKHEENKPNEEKTTRQETSVADKDRSSTLEKKSKEDMTSEQVNESKKHKLRKRRKGSAEDPKENVTVQGESAMHEEESKNVAEETNEQVTAASRAPRPASAKGQRRKPSGNSRSTKIPDSVDSPDESHTTSRKLSRPPSARPAAPRVQRKNIAEEEIARIDSGGKQRTAPVFVDHGSTPSDEDETFVVEEQSQPDLYATESTSHDLDTKSEEHGGLVRKILETKKELEHSAYGKSEEKSLTDIRASNVTTAQNRKEYELVMKEIEKLRASVQTVCQSATPLAKIIDYIQEDMDAMQTELQMWCAENKEYEIKIQEEESVTQRCVKSSQAELEEVEEGILSYRNQVAATKANILRNKEKINKMVKAVAARS